jgi:hypothetical protein
MPRTTAICRVPARGDADAATGSDAEAVGGRADCPGRRCAIGGGRTRLTEAARRRAQLGGRPGSPAGREQGAASERAFWKRAAACQRPIDRDEVPFVERGRTVPRPLLCRVVGDASGAAPGSAGRRARVSWPTEALRRIANLRRVDEIPGAQDPLRAQARRRNRGRPQAGREVDAAARHPRR